MSTLVVKFGGASIATTERIMHVANRIQREKENGYQIVVVVSAMGKTTDQLVKMAHEISETPSKREMDVLLTTGEQVTISLLSMTLHKLGLQALSFTGWQAGIVTEHVPSNARIGKINPSAVKEALDAGMVALAAALQAERCDIHTDVDGIYTINLRYVKGARKLAEMSYDEMLELVNLGAGVLHPRSVEVAKNHHILMSVRSSYEDVEETTL